MVTRDLSLYLLSVRGMKDSFLGQTACFQGKGKKEGREEGKEKKERDERSRKTSMFSICKSFIKICLAFVKNTII